MTCQLGGEGHAFLQPRGWGWSCLRRTAEAAVKGPFSCSLPVLSVVSTQTPAALAGQLDLIVTARGSGPSTAERVCSALLQPAL